MTTQRKFGRKPATVGQMCGGNAQAAAWNTVREWTGPHAEVTNAMRQTVERLSR